MSNNILPDQVDLISKVCEVELFNARGYAGRTHAAIANYLMIGRPINHGFFDPEQLKQFHTYVMTCETLGSGSLNGRLFMMTMLQDDITEKYRAAMFDIFGNQISHKALNFSDSSGVTTRDEFWHWFTHEFDQMRWYKEQIHRIHRIHARRASECANALNLLTRQESNPS